MLSRQPLWMPVLKHTPIFAQAFGVFLNNNPISTGNLEALRITPETMFVALEETAPPKNLGLSAERLSYMMAFPITVSREACDVDPVTGKRCLNIGFFTSLSDTCNSMHIMERLMPHRFPHVSVVMRTELLRPHPGIVEGEKLLMVSTVDKMGKRLVYCKTDLYVDPEHVPDAIKQKESQMTTLADLKEGLERYEKVITATHIKNILPNKKWG